MIIMVSVYLLIAMGVSTSCSDLGEGHISDILVGLLWPIFLGMLIGDRIREKTNKVNQEGLQ